MVVFIDVIVVKDEFTVIAGPFKRKMIPQFPGSSVHNFIFQK